MLTLCVISGNCKWQFSLARLAHALWVSVCVTSNLFFFFYPRWGVSTSHQPVFQCNYSVSVSLNASKDVHVMKTSWAISHPDYSGRVSVIKVWMSDAMGHLWIGDVLYAQVGDKWNSASAYSAWLVCTCRRCGHDCSQMSVPLLAFVECYLFIFLCGWVIKYLNIWP